MALLYSQVKSEIMIPQANIVNNRSEFHIKGEDRVFLSDMRLINVGLHGQAGKNYNRLGVDAIINSITLYNGSEILSQSESHKHRALHKHMINSNTFNFSKKGREEQSNMTFDLALVNNNIRVDARLYGLANMPETGATEATTASGIIHIADYLPILKSLPSISTAIFDNLRLVIVYNNNYDEMLTNNQNAANLLTNTPLLVCEEVFDNKLKSKMVSNMKSVQWYETELDRCEMPADTSTLTAGNQTVQRLNTRVNGFNKKYVKNILVQVSTMGTNERLNGQNISGFGRLGSRYEDGATYNLRVNGANLYPRQGLNRPSYRLRQHSHVYPNSVAFPQSSTAAAFANRVENGIRVIPGTLDYPSLNVFNRIEDLQFIFEREHSLDDDNVYNQRLQFLLFGQVLKQIMIKGGKYVIAYA
jgi:hypothetical protein